MKLARLSLIAALALAGTAHAQTLIGGGKNPPTFPIVISQPGSYKLAGNLVVPAGVSAILIPSSDVTLDLNGFTVSGPVVCSYTSSLTCNMTAAPIGGIVADGSNVVVRNGTVRGFQGNGLVIRQNSVAEDLVLVGNANRAVRAEKGSTFRNVRAVMNANGGIEGDGVRVEAAQAFRNGVFGISVFGGALVLSSLATENAGVGLGLNTGSAVHQSVFYGNLGGSMVGNGLSMGNNLCQGATC
jgi:hypothetical protein